MSRKFIRMSTLLLGWLFSINFYNVTFYVLNAIAHTVPKMLHLIILIVTYDISTGETGGYVQKKEIYTQRMLDFIGFNEKVNKRKPKLLESHLTLFHLCDCYFTIHQNKIKLSWWRWHKMERLAPISIASKQIKANQINVPPVSNSDKRKIM